MDKLVRQDVGDFLGVITFCLVAGALSYLLSPLARRSRIRRAALWYGARAVGGAAWVTVSVAIGGVHQVIRSRATGGWVDMHWSRGDALKFGLSIGVVGAAFALWLPWGAAAPDTRPRGPRRRKHPIQRSGG